MRPVRVEIITYAPTAFFHCGHCEIALHHLGVGARMRRMDADESLPDDLRRDYQELSCWAREVHERYAATPAAYREPIVDVRVVDAASLAGIWASLRHGIRSHPAVIVEGRRVHVEDDYRVLDELIDDLVHRKRAAAG